MSDSGIPLYAQFCSNCKFAREAATQCRIEPLHSVFIGNLPKDGLASPLLVGGSAGAAAAGGIVMNVEPKFVPVVRPAYPQFWCGDWQEMPEDHPDHPSRQRLVPRDFSTIFTPEKAS